MNRIVSICLAISMALCLTACDQKAQTPSPAPATPAPATSASPEEPAKIDYPTKPTTVIVPFAAGDGSDVMNRAVTAAVPLEQPMVTTCIEGSGSSIGTMEAYHADPDGYTVCCLGLEALIAGVLSGTYPEADSYEKFIPLCSIADDAFIITPSKASGFTSLEELVEYAKANSGKVTCSGTGSNSITNAAAQMFFDACGIDVTFVPFDSSFKNRAAVMGSHTMKGDRYGT